VPASVRPLRSLRGPLAAALAAALAGQSVAAARAADRWAGDGPAGGPPPGRLAQALQPLLDGRDGTFGVLVEHQPTVDRFGRQADRPFRAASVYKLPLAFEVVRRVDRGQLGLDDELTIEPSDAVEPEPLGGLDVGDQVTVRRALEATIGVSSNAAAHALMRLIGRPELNRAWTAMGWHETRVPEVETAAADDPDGWATTSAADMADLLDRFLRGQLLGPLGNQVMLELLARPDRQDPLLGALPGGTEHFEKTGNVDDASTIASVIYAPSGPLILVVLDEDMSPPSARALIGDVASAAYAAVAGDQ
jgi:beta-lactamase class A